MKDHRWHSPGLSTTVAFAGKRLSFGVLVLLAIILLSYLGLEMARGTDFWTASGHTVRSTAAYVGRLARGDLGLSAAGSVTSRPTSVARIVSETLPRTLGLLAGSLLLSALVGISLGLVAATRRNEGGSLILVISSVAGMSLPSFFTALLLQLAVVRLARATGLSLLPVGGFGWDEHLVLPVLVLAGRPIAQTARITYVKMREVLATDFVRTAYSKGLTKRRVIIRHAIRNAAIPILTTLTVSLRFSLSSLPVVEYFFGWPGVGLVLLKSIARQDDNTTIALLLCLGVLFILVNLAVESVYRFIDPRLRSKTDNTGGRLTRINVVSELKSLCVTAKEALRHNPIGRVKSAGRSLRQWLADDLLVRWSLRRMTKIRQGWKLLRSERREEPRAALAIDLRRSIRRTLTRFPRSGSAEPDLISPPVSGKRLPVPQRVLSNLPLILGGVLLMGLVVVVLFGPYMTPHSPFTTHGLERVNGQWRVPPFSPDGTYLLGTDLIGRDILSLILAGAQQTLLLAGLAVTARAVVGVIFGAVAGWFNGTWLDRFLLGLSELIAAFPTLLMVMILILAIGIRQGLRPFVIALCFVGWGEIAQYVRSEVLALRARPFIESAHAVGVGVPRILLSHIVPHLIPSLIPIIALEMGAVLMLLGELGLLNIFIGGGTYFERSMVIAPYLYSDIPEWGALLSNIRTYARAYPWVAIYPSLAFFLSALGFNLFGEGLRAMAEKGKLRLQWLFNRYAIIIVLLVALGIHFVQTNTGAMAYYRQSALSFRGDVAMQHVAALTDPEMHGRALGSPGVGLAADYIAKQFEELGVFEGGSSFTYFDAHERSFYQLIEQPNLAIDDTGTALHYREDYAEYAGQYQTTGSGTGEVLFLATGELFGNMLGDYEEIECIDLADRIVLVPSDREANYLERERMPIGGVLVVAENDFSVAKRVTLPADRSVSTLFHPDDELMDFPKLLITSDVAQRLLNLTGRSVQELQQEAAALAPGAVLQVETHLSATVSVQGSAIDDFPVRHVISYLPGTVSGDQLGRTGLSLADQVILVMVQYDSPAANLAEADYAAANDNASGVAVMLEAIRVLQETGYQPFKTILFAAYSGEGYEDGHYTPDLEPDGVLQAAPGFSTGYEVEAVVRLRGLGAGGDRLALSATGNLRLLKAFQEAARRVGVRTLTVEDVIDIGVIYEGRSIDDAGEDAPQIVLSWQGWENTAKTAQDSVNTLSSRQLEQAGRTLALALMTLARETY